MLVVKGDDKEDENGDFELIFVGFFLLCPKDPNHLPIMAYYVQYTVHVLM